MRIGSLRRLALAVSSTSFVLGIAGGASANGFEIPENGTEIMGRGGAWTAKADSPMALQLNPAGLAGQKSALLVNANLTWQSMCFQRNQRNFDGSSGYINPTDASSTIFRGQQYGGDPYPEVCKKNGLADVNVVPQIVYAHRIDDRLTVAGGIVTPSGAGKSDWPTQVTTSSGVQAPAPQRYMLLSANTIILYPTISAGYAVTERVRLGLSLQWGLAFLKFSNVSMATQPDVTESPNQDLRADLKANSYFIPAVIAGGLFDVTDDVSIGGMFRWSKDVVVTNAPVTITGPFYGNTTANPCGAPNTPCQTAAHANKIDVPQPIDARLGFRFHPKRKDAKTTKKYERRDTLSGDLFDAEVDLTYSHNKTFDTLGIFFPDPSGTSAQHVAMGSNGSAGVIPADASVPHHWADSVGVRVGFELPVLPNQLSLRLGGFLQTNAVSAQYAGIDFLPSRMIGGFLGGTWRLSSALDLSAGLGHIFVQTVDNGDTGQVRALVASENQAKCPSDPSAVYRSCEAVNSGRYTAGYNMVSLGATIHL